MCTCSSVSWMCTSTMQHVRGLSSASLMCTCTCVSQSVHVLMLSRHACLDVVESCKENISADIKSKYTTRQNDMVISFLLWMRQSAAATCLLPCTPSPIPVCAYLCVCVCVCVCMGACVCVRERETKIQTDCVCQCMRVCVYSCLMLSAKVPWQKAYAYAYIYLYIYICNYMLCMYILYVYMYLSLCTYIYKYTYMYMYMYVHIIHTHMYIDACIDNDCFYYHSWRNNVVIAFGTLSSYI